jgi:hypothetical protein
MVADLIPGEPELPRQAHCLAPSVHEQLGCRALGHSARDWYMPQVYINNSV